MKQDQNAALAKIIIGAQLVMALFVYGVIVRGLTLSVLWGWFVEPLGPPGLNIAEAMGFAIVVGFLMPTRIERDEEGNVKKVPLVDGIVQGVGTITVTCLFSLFFGYIIHLFV